MVWIEETVITYGKQFTSSSYRVVFLYAAGEVNTFFLKALPNTETE